MLRKQTSKKFSQFRFFSSNYRVCLYLEICYRKLMAFPYQIIYKLPVSFLNMWFVLSLSPSIWIGIDTGDHRSRSYNNLNFMFSASKSSILSQCKVLQYPTLAIRNPPPCIDETYLPYLSQDNGSNLLQWREKIQPKAEFFNQTILQDNADTC